MTLWFETHATSLDNERGLASGHIDVELSDLGREQARQLGMRYRERPVSTIYTSDLKRAIETAEIAFAGQSPARISDSRLRECDYGAWSGATAARLDSRPDFIDRPFPGGESYRDVTRRMDRFLTSLPAAEKTILIIGHRATWYALEHLLGKRDLREVIASHWRWQPGWVYEKI